MKEFEAFCRVLEDLKNGVGATFGINIPVSGEAYFDCIRLNESLERTDINFLGMCRPHVTLKMGRVQNVDDLEKIFELCKEIFSNFLCGEICPQPAILKKPCENYYFCEIEDEKLMKISHLLDEKIGNLMQQARHPISDENKHHITLGYRFDSFPKSQAVLGESVSRFSYDRICVSVVAEHGVSLGSLRTFILKREA